MEQDGNFGITWNNTTESVSQYTTDNRFDFHFTPQVLQLLGHQVQI